VNREEAADVRANKMPLVRAFTINRVTRPWYDWAGYRPYEHYWSSVANNWIWPSSYIASSWVEVDKLDTDISGYTSGEGRFDVDWDEVTRRHSGVLYRWSLDHRHFTKALNPTLAASYRPSRPVSLARGTVHEAAMLVRDKRPADASGRRLRKSRPPGGVYAEQEVEPKETQKRRTYEPAQQRRRRHLHKSANKTRLTKKSEEDETAEKLAEAPTLHKSMARTKVKRDEAAEQAGKGAKSPSTNSNTGKPTSTWKRGSSRRRAAAWANIVPTQPPSGAPEHWDEAPRVEKTSVDMTDEPPSNEPMPFPVAWAEQIKALHKEIEESISQRFAEYEQDEEDDVETLEESDIIASVEEPEPILAFESPDDDSPIGANDLALIEQALQYRPTESTIIAEPSDLEDVIDAPSRQDDGMAETIEVDAQQTVDINAEEPAALPVETTEQASPKRRFRLRSREDDKNAEEQVAQVIEPQAIEQPAVAPPLVETAVDADSPVMAGSIEIAEALPPEGIQPSAPVAPVEAQVPVQEVPALPRVASKPPSVVRGIRRRKALRTPSHRDLELPAYPFQPNPHQQNPYQQIPYYAPPVYPQMPPGYPPMPQAMPNYSPYAAGYPPMPQAMPNYSPYAPGYPPIPQGVPTYPPYPPYAAGYPPMPPDPASYPPGYQPMPPAPVAETESAREPVAATDNAPTYAPPTYERSTTRSADGAPSANLVRSAPGAARMSPNQRRKKNSADEPRVQSDKSKQPDVNKVILDVLKLYNQSQSTDASDKKNASLEKVLLNLIALSGQTPQRDEDEDKVS